MGSVTKKNNNNNNPPENLNIERIVCEEDIIRNKNCKFNAKYFLI